MSLHVCLWCQKAATEFGHLITDMHVVTVDVDGEQRKVVLWTDRVHASCEPEDVKAALRDPKQVSSERPR